MDQLRIRIKLFKVRNLASQKSDFWTPGNIIMNNFPRLQFDDEENIEPLESEYIDSKKSHAYKDCQCDFRNLLHE